MKNQKNIPKPSNYKNNLPSKGENEFNKENINCYNQISKQNIKTPPNSNHIIDRTELNFKKIKDT